MQKKNKNRIKHSKLSNGMELITERLPSYRSVAFSVWLKAGSRYENAEQNGISHFIEHLIFKGTEELNALEISQRVDDMGGTINAFTSREEISFYIKLLDTQIDRGIDLLSDIVLHPAFRKPDIELERMVILEEIRMLEDNPEDSVIDFYFQNFYPDHPLGRPVQGKIDSVSKLNRKKIKAYYENALMPEKIVIAAAGNLKHEKILERIQKIFSDLDRTGVRNKLSPPKSKSINSIKTRPQLEQVRFVMGRDGVPITDDDRYAATLLSTLLGGNSSSRLFQKVREERGLVYDISSVSLSFQDCGIFGIAAGCQPKSIPELMKIINTELRNLTQTPPSAEELTRLKNFVKGNMMLSLESSSARMTRLAKQIIHYGRYFTLDEMLEKIDRITCDDLFRIANKILKGRWSMAVIQPESSPKIDPELLNING